GAPANGGDLCVAQAARREQAHVALGLRERCELLDPASRLAAWRGARRGLVPNHDGRPWAHVGSGSGAGWALSAASATRSSSAREWTPSRSAASLRRRETLESEMLSSSAMRF